jgi:hypothetical protein
MKCRNVGNIDRSIRIVVGVTLIVWASTGGPVWAYIGILPLITGLFRYCPAYTLFGCKSCECDSK